MYLYLSLVPSLQSMEVFILQHMKKEMEWRTGMRCLMHALGIWSLSRSVFGVCIMLCVFYTRHVCGFLMCMFACSYTKAETPEQPYLLL